MTIQPRSYALFDPHGPRVLTVYCDAAEICIPGQSPALIDRQSAADALRYCRRVGTVERMGDSTDLLLR